MNIKKILARTATTSAFIFVLYVLGDTENKRKALVKEAEAANRLRVKNKVLAEVFGDAFDLLSEEDAQKVMEKADIEMKFAKIILKED